MCGQAHRINTVRIKFCAISIPDNIHASLGKHQGIVSHLPAHGSACKLQGDIPRLVIGQPDSAAEFNLPDCPFPDFKFPGIKHLRFSKHQVRQFYSLFITLNCKADMVNQGQQKLVF